MGRFGHALAGGVALSVMVSTAQADELSDLKAQLLALQERVDALASHPNQAPVAPGVSLITFHRGQGDLADFGPTSTPDDRGFTVAITPIADLPAPVAEITVYGYVKGDVIYDFNQDVGDGFFVPALWSKPYTGKAHIRLHARQSRFGIKSKTDTAIGQIRTTIEGDFFGGNTGDSFRLRHAFGEWDMTSNWTFLAGQTWKTANIVAKGITTVDFTGPAGPNFSTGRTPQIRMTYHGGPLSWATAIENPTWNSDTAVPNISTLVQYDLSSDYQFLMSGTVADWKGHTYTNQDIGWAVQAGANIKVADFARLTVGGAYGQYEICKYLNQSGQFCGTFIDADMDGAPDFMVDNAYGVSVAAAFDVTDTTTITVAWGWDHMHNHFKSLEGIDAVNVMTVHANVLWQPVSQMRLGWELMWGQYDFDAGPGFQTNVVGKNRHDFRAQFGSWFYF